MNKKQIIMATVVSAVITVSICVLGTVMQFAAIGVEMPITHFVYGSWAAWSETAMIWAGEVIAWILIVKEVRKMLSEIGN